MQLRPQTHQLNPSNRRRACTGKYRRSERPDLQRLCKKVLTIADKNIGTIIIPAGIFFKKSIIITYPLLKGFFLLCIVFVSFLLFFSFAFLLYVFSELFKLNLLYLTFFIFCMYGRLLFFILLSFVPLPFCLLSLCFLSFVLCLLFLALLFIFCRLRIFVPI